MTAEVRSGRSGGPVVVVGSGPLAAAVLAAFAPDAAGPAAGARLLPNLPAVAPEAAVAGARALVLVADPADLSTTREGDAADRRAALVRQTQAALEAARAAGVPHVVAVTSAMVHGAEPGRAVIADDEPPRTEPEDGFAGDLVAVESVLARAAQHRTADAPDVAVVRPAAVVGPGVDTLVTRHFAAPRLLTLRGVDRPWQLVHVDDVGSAVALVVERGWTGGVTVAAEPVLTTAQVLRASRLRRLELPAHVAFATAERLHRVGVLPVPAAELAYTVHPWTVDPARLREVGWRARHSAEECLAVLLDGVRGSVAVAGRQVDRREVALGAAGAAVAFLGTAAAWRQARGPRF